MVEEALGLVQRPKSVVQVVVDKAAPLLVRLEPLAKVMMVAMQITI